MNRQDLYEGIGEIDEDILERSEQNQGKKKNHRPWWIGSVAAVLALAVVGSVLFWPFNNSRLPAVEGAICEAVYPEMAEYPNEMNFINQLTGEYDSEGRKEAYEVWKKSVDDQKQQEGYAEGLEPFLTESIQTMLSGTEGENRACSPLNVYMALGMLAELTDGSSRQQILDAIGVDGIEELRTQAKAVWNAHYRDDGATTSILASSLWLNEDVNFVPSTMETLANTYYASSYQGEMGSEEFNRALQTWLDQQTGGLLKEQVQELSMDAETILAIATTVYFQAKWKTEFRKDRTSEDTFHAIDGDITCDFMHSSETGTYYWGERFGAVKKRLENDGGTMWFLLPDEGVSVEELLNDSEAMEFLLANGEWDNQKDLIVNLSLPKFDLTSQLDLQESLQKMGITDVFDGAVSDFSPMTTDMEGIFVSQAKHDVRVVVDEEGVTAAAYTVMMEAGAAAPPENEIDFVLDRPFVFALASEDGLPLFAGVVARPQ